MNGRPSHRPWSVRSRSLVRLEEGLAVFIQERVPAMDRPVVPGLFAWLGAVALVFALPLLFCPV